MNALGGADRMPLRPTTLRKAFKLDFLRPRSGVRGNLFAAFAVIGGMAIVNDTLEAIEAEVLRAEIDAFLSNMRAA
jgi:hypothetical protein